MKIRLRPRQAYLIDRALREKLSGQDFSRDDEIHAWEVLVNPQFKALVERYSGPSDTTRS